MFFPSLCDGKFPEELRLKIKKQYKMQEHAWVLTIGFFCYTMRKYGSVWFLKRQKNYSKQLIKQNQDTVDCSVQQIKICWYRFKTHPSQMLKKISWPYI